MATPVNRGGAPVTMGPAGFWLDADGSVAATDQQGNPQVTPGMQDNPQSAIYYDADRDLYYNMVNGQKEYQSPYAYNAGDTQPNAQGTAHGAQNPTGGLIHTGGTWNPDSGEFDQSIDWGNLLSMAIAGTLTGGVADAVMGGAAAPSLAGIEGAEFGLPSSAASALPGFVSAADIAAAAPAAAAAAPALEGVAAGAPGATSVPAGSVPLGGIENAPFGLPESTVADMPGAVGAPNPFVSFADAPGGLPSASNIPAGANAGLPGAGTGLPEGAGLPPLPSHPNIPPGANAGLPSSTPSGVVPAGLGGNDPLSNIGKYAKLLSGVGSAINGATQQSAQNRIAQNDPYVQRGRLEGEQRKDALKEVYMADFARNPSHSPFDPVAPRMPGADLSRAYADVSSQGVSQLDKPPQYLTSEFPSLQPGTLEKLGQWAGPILKILGSLGGVVNPRTPTGQTPPFFGDT